MATRIKNLVLKLRPGTWSLNRFLDLRLALFGRLTTLVMLKSDGQDDEEQDEN